MKHFRIAAVVALTVALTFAASAPDGKRWWSYVQALANDQMRGRNTDRKSTRLNSSH